MPTQLFDVYTHCPVCGKAGLVRAGGVLTCGCCGFRLFNNPVTAVAVFVLDAQNRALLIRRAHQPSLGKLTPPGGFLEAGEALEEAAVREVAEETGLELHNMDYLCAFPNHYVYGGVSRPVCDVFFTARVGAVTVSLRDGEASGFEWLTLEEIDPSVLAFDSMRRALAVLRSRQK